MKTLNALLASVAAMTLAGAAQADVIYNNPFDFAADVGDCSFSTVCAAQAKRGDDFAAQKFVLGSAAVITGAGFSELDLGKMPTDVSWSFIMADGLGGLPGTILAAGIDTITSNVVLGNDGTYTQRQLLWDLGTVALDAGAYYFSIQAISPVFDTYLAQGVATSGAAETHNSGVTWTPGYQQLSSVAVELFGTGGGAGVPEPATWALMLAGFGGVGLAMRRRSRAVAQAA